VCYLKLPSKTFGARAGSSLGHNELFQSNRVITDHSFASFSLTQGLMATFGGKLFNEKEGKNCSASPSGLRKKLSLDKLI
jgi:hypothetical protein